MNTHHILILTSDSGKTASWKDREQYVKAFAEAVEKRLSNFSISYATYSDMHYAIRKNVPVILDAKNDRKLEEYDFVHFKNWQYELEDASIIANYLDHHGVSFANTEVNNHLHFNKLSQMFSMAFAGIPVPDTVYGYPATNDVKQFLYRYIEYPMIVKANDGSRGDSNYLVHNEAELDNVLLSDPDKHFIYQNFIPNEGDYRILFVGLDREPMVFLRKGDGSSHLNNTSKGGAGTHLKFADLSDDIRQHAQLAAKTLNREISGVDVIVNSENGKHYVLEVNSTPALATGFDVDKKVVEFSQYLEQLLEEKEEE